MALKMICSNAELLGSQTYGQTSTSPETMSGCDAATRTAEPPASEFPTMMAGPLNSPMSAATSPAVAPSTRASWTGRCRRRPPSRPKRR